MKAAAKYLFDEDFGTGEKPTITLIEAERRRADAESVAYRNGFAAGQAQAQHEAGERTAAALAVIADGLSRIERALAGIEIRLETEAVEVAVAVGEKLAAELIAREPFTEIAALAAQCFRQLVTTPHIAVRIAPDIYDEARHKLEDSARVNGFSPCSPTPVCLRAIAASNGRREASTATAPPPAPRSRTWSHVTLQRASPPHTEEWRRHNVG